MPCATGSGRSVAVLALLASTFGIRSLTGAEVQADLSRLPPPVSTSVEFSRDIRPILETSCLRCHGPEKPRSHFRLDNRDSALKGGEQNHDDIIPGDSARSHLVQYVSGAVEDMQMPPPGKGEPLTPEQIGRIRAWIDQGAKWDETSPFPQSNFSLTPAGWGIGVDGDKSKFRELEGVKEGAGGGVKDFFLEQRDGPDRRFVIQGHVLTPGNDEQLKLTWSKTDLGFVRAGFDRWRRYYDDSGGFYRQFTPPQFDLDRDLHLDTGRAWIDFGLTLPDKPQVVLGYEYRFKDGSKSMLEWGGVNSVSGPKNIYPASKGINEQTHVLKLDASYEVAGWRFDDNARVEISSLQTRDRQVPSYTTGPDLIFNTKQDYTHVQGANTFRLEKQITSWWFGSGGYLYSRFEGDSSLAQTTTDAGGNLTPGLYWNDQVTLSREAHAFDLASLIQPMTGLSLSLGVQTEFSREQGFGTIDLAVGDPNALTPQQARVQTDLDETKVMETALLRYTKLPYTILFAEGRFSQDRIGQFENEAGVPPDALPDFFARNTDFANNLADLRAGFSTSPWRWMTLNAHYRWRDSDSDYDHLLDTNNVVPPGEGYSAFTRHREITTQEAEARLVLHPLAWLKTTLSYQRTTSHFSSIKPPVGGGISPGGGILDSATLADVYGLNAVVVPLPRLYLSGAFTYTDTHTETGQSVPTVVPYKGGLYTVIAAARYSLNPRTSFQAAYSFSQADYGQNNPAGLPLGIDYTRHGLNVGVTRQMTKCLSGSLAYRFYRYAESSSGGLNDFTAHGVFATVSVRWP